MEAGKEVTARSHEAYVHALRYSWLTDIYDPVVRWTCREITFKSALIRQARLLPSHAVLDLGCGTGTMTVSMNTLCPRARIVGLDGDRQILEIARAKAAKQGLEIVFDHGRSSELPYADRSFDRVLSSFLFHHLGTNEKRGTLQEAFRVLKPGGELHVADWGKPGNPFARGAFLFVQMLDGFQTTADTVKGLLPSFMADAGFLEVAETMRFATVFGVLALMSAKKPPRG